MELTCATCRVQACRAEPGEKLYPSFCPMAHSVETLAEARQAYEDPPTREFALAAARTEAGRYPLVPRVEEVMNFARRLGVNRLGIASCVGLLREAQLLQDILEANGFDVCSVCCKVGSIPKEDVGLSDEEKIRPGQFEALCNPIGQATLLNRAGSRGRYTVLRPAGVYASRGSHVSRSIPSADTKSPTDATGPSNRLSCPIS